MIDHVKELFETGTTTVRKERGQAAGTFMPHNAAAMIGCVASEPAFWKIHPSVQRDLYMWGVEYAHSPFDCRYDEPRLFGLPIRFETDCQLLGTKGDVVLLCAAGNVQLETRGE